MRIIALIAILLVGIWLPFWWFAVVVVGYAFFFFAWDLILLGICIDILFGIGTFPYYTLLVGLVVICIEGLRPKLFVS